MKTQAAITASAIRKELAQKFPDIKFRVISQDCAHGNSVLICWTGMPAEEAVEKIANRYEQGYFDGVTDRYVTLTNPENLPQVKFVFYEHNRE